MGEIRDKVTIEGNKKTVTIDDALFDSGANAVFIARELADDIGLTEKPQRYPAKGAFDEKEEEHAQTALGDIVINGCKRPVQFAIVEKLPREKLIIGFLAMEQLGIELDPMTKKIKAIKCPPPFYL